MRILVTGGAGFIGSHIVDQCVAAGHEVAIVDSLWEEGGGKGENLNPKARFFHMDITDEARLQSIFDEISAIGCSSLCGWPVERFNQLYTRRDA